MRGRDPHGETPAKNETVRLMAKMTFGARGGRIRTQVTADRPKPSRSIEEIFKDLEKTSDGEGYRERSLALHGYVCARCGRDFGEKNRHLLTVHHKDGNHQNNPPDGSNWENLCVYCHEDVHSRELLGDFYAAQGAAGKETSLVYHDPAAPATAGANGPLGALGEKLKKALEKKS